MPFEVLPFRSFYQSDRKFWYHFLESDCSFTEQVLWQGLLTFALNLFKLIEMLHALNCLKRKLQVLGKILSVLLLKWAGTDHNLFLFQNLVDFFLLML